jgi:uncharacterized protein
MWNEKFDASICSAPRGHMGTFSGGYVCPLHIDPETIKIEDIAHSLSISCRWGGHCRHHYSIGLHSLVVARLVYELGQSPEVVRQGLLHDGSEAFLNDLPSPIKYDPSMHVYRAAERRLEETINAKFGCPFKVKDDCPDVAWADFVALCIEGRDLFDYERGPDVFGVKTWPDMRLYEVVARVFFPPLVSDINEKTGEHMLANIRPAFVEAKFLNVFRHGFDGN